MIAAFKGDRRAIQSDSEKVDSRFLVAAFGDARISLFRARVFVVRRVKIAAIVEENPVVQAPRGDALEERERFAELADEFVITCKGGAVIVASGVLFPFFLESRGARKITFDQLVEELALILRVPVVVESFDEFVNPRVCLFHVFLIFLQLLFGESEIGVFCVVVMIVVSSATTATATAMNRRQRAAARADGKSGGRGHEIYESLKKSMRHIRNFPFCIAAFAPETSRSPFEPGTRSFRQRATYSLNYIRLGETNKGRRGLLYHEARSSRLDSSKEIFV